MKKILLRCFISFFICVLTILMLEATLRISNVWIGRHSDTMFTLVEYDPYLGWRMKPRLNTQIDLVDIEDIPIQTNSQGFWDRELSLEKPENVCRILFLGDSFTWGMGVREEERFTNLLRETNPGWETLNFGVPGHGTDQALLLWQRFAHSFKPDVVVLTVYENDYKDNMHLVRYGRRKPYFELTKEGDLVSKGLPVDRTDFWDDGVFNQAAPPYELLFEQPVQKRSRFIHWLAKNSDLARSLYTLWRRVQIAPESSSVSTEATPSDLTTVQEKQVELLLALVNQLAREIQAQETRLVILFAGHLTPQHQMAMESLKEKGVIVIDVTSAVFTNQISHPQENVYHRFSKHWTPAAHRIAAEVIGEEIHRLGFCRTHEA